MPSSALTRYYEYIPRVRAQQALAWLPVGQLASGWLKRGSASGIMNQLHSLAFGIQVSGGVDALTVIHQHISQMEREGRAITQVDVERARMEGRLPEFLASVVDGKVPNGNG